MVLPIDSSKPFRLHNELVELVNAVQRAGGADESRWIEWKGTLDLSTTPGQHHLVRQILGFANRDPDIAARWAAGFAYLIVGAEPGVSEPAGVEPVDAATLEPQLARWLPEEIIWTMDYVRFGNADVLVITVDPPSWGDPIHTLQKAIGSHTPGTVFVRHQASIVTATPTDMKMLQRRYAAGDRRTRLEITPSIVEVEPRPDLDSFIEGWRADTERKLMHYAEHPLRSQPLPHYSLTSSASLTRVVPDTRTPQEYVAEVTRYLDVAESAIADRADRLLPLRRLKPLELTLRNLTDHTLNDIELVMVFQGQAQLQLVGPDSPEPELTRLPVPPKPLGTTRTTTQFNPAITGSIASINAALYGARSRVQAAEPALPAILLPRDKGPKPARVTAKLVPDGLEIRFPRFDLRAEDTYALPAIFLDIFEPEGSTCQLRWKATSDNQPGTSTGSVRVQLATSSFDLTQLTSTRDADS